LWRAPASGPPVRLTEEPGVHGGVAGGDVLVVSSSSIDRDDVATVIWRGNREVCRVGSGAARPVLRPDVTLVHAGDKDLRSAVWPSGGGRSEGIWPLWPCYAGPTCSTPRSSARRSPTGASTTRTTPSATWGTPTPIRTRTSAARCSATPRSSSGRSS